MNVLLVCSSKTGNTRKVASAAEEVFDVKCTPVEEKPSADGYDLVLAGYWADRGKPDAKMKAYLGTLSRKRVTLFATLGADPDSDHAKDVLQAGCDALGEKCEVLGTFICQGRVDPVLIEQMKKMFPAGHPHAMTPERLEKLAAGAAHPDAEDLAHARAFFEQVRTDAATR